MGHELFLSVYQNPTTEFERDFVEQRGAEIADEDGVDNGLGIEGELSNKRVGYADDETAGDLSTFAHGGRYGIGDYEGGTE